MPAAHLTEHAARLDALAVFYTFRGLDALAEAVAEMAEMYRRVAAELRGE